MRHLSTKHIGAGAPSALFLGALGCTVSQLPAQGNSQQRSNIKTEKAVLLRNFARLSFMRAASSQATHGGAGSEDPGVFGHNATRSRRIRARRIIATNNLMLIWATSIAPHVEADAGGLPRRCISAGFCNRIPAAYLANVLHTAHTTQPLRVTPVRGDLRVPLNLAQQREKF